jgi:hypothetical protein
MPPSSTIIKEITMNMNEEANYMIKEVGCSEPFIDTDIHPLDVMAALCEAEADNPCNWDPEDFVSRHIMEDFLTVKEGTYVGTEDNVTDYTTITTGSLYKRMEDTGTEATILYQFDIEAEFWHYSRKVEVGWYLSFTKLEEGDTRANVEIEYDMDMADGKLTFNEWPTVDGIKTAVNVEIGKYFASMF